MGEMMTISFRSSYLSANTYWRCQLFGRTQLKAFSISRLIWILQNKDTYIQRQKYIGISSNCFLQYLISFQYIQSYFLNSFRILVNISDLATICVVVCHLVAICCHKCG